MNSADENTFWPVGLTRHRLDDAAMAAAYASSHARQRACIKHTLALLHTVWGEYPDSTAQRKEYSAQGLCLHTRQAPRPWAVAVIEPSYNAPTRLAAAVMCAVLARVPHISLCCVGGMPSASVCLALELAGVENIFCPPLADIAPLLYSLPGKGICLLLHKGVLTPLAAALRAATIVVWEESCPPHLHIEANAPHDQDLIRWCHPDALLQAATHNTCPDALYTVYEGTPRAPLCLLPHMEGCWLHPALSPDMFCERAVLAAVPAHGESV